MHKKFRIIFKYNSSHSLQFSEIFLMCTNMWMLMTIVFILTDKTFLYDCHRKQLYHKPIFSKYIFIIFAIFK